MISLILHGKCAGKLSGTCIAAMESHKRYPCVYSRICLDIAESYMSSGTVLLISRSVTASWLTQVPISRSARRKYLLRQDTRYPTSQTAVDISRERKAKLCLECRPAFACNGNVFAVASVLFDPVKQRKLILCQFQVKSPALVVPRPVLFPYLSSHRRFRTIRMLVIRFK